MEINDIGTQLLYTTVPIYAHNSDKSLSTGTGFLFSVRESETESIPLLITNYHVLKDAMLGFVELHIGEKGFPTDKTIRVQFDKSIIDGNKLGKLDLIAVPLAGTFNDFQNRNIEIFFRTVDQNMVPTKEQEDKLSAIENITFIGYPSGLYDEKNKISIIRQGITATPIWNDFKGTYPVKDGIALGSRLIFVGVLSKTMLRDNATGKAYLNLGEVINSRAMYCELNKFIQRLKGTM